MTGAPKLRSVQLLEELEGHRPRGVYSGAFLAITHSRSELMDFATCRRVWFRRSGRNDRLLRRDPHARHQRHRSVSPPLSLALSLTLPEELTLGAGGAITHLSEVANEWEEVLVKTEAVVGRAKT